MKEPWINLTNYTAAEHLFFAAGCALWVVVYLLVIGKIRRAQFIEIPLVAVCANFVWEFLWSWVFRTDMGLLYVWGYRLWFFLDCFIVYGLFQYGYRQITQENLRQQARLLIVVALACWAPMLYFYIRNYDYPLSHNGAYSGYILNVMMSALYIPALLRVRDLGLFSLPSAWSKGVGTLLISVFCFLHFNDWFLLSMCLVNTVLDAAYIVLFYRLKKTELHPNV